MIRVVIILSLLLGVALGVAAAAARRGRAAAGGQHPFNPWEKLILVANLGSLTALAVTGFWTTLVLGHRMEGFTLMIHTSLGGVFITSLAALAVTFAEAARINDADWRGAAPGRFTLAPKLAFWSMLALGVAAALTVLISMLPLFGTSGLILLYEAHRYCGLGVASVVVGFGTYIGLRSATPRTSVASGAASGR